MAGINIKSISALETKGKAKYYTTCFVEKKIFTGFQKLTILNYVLLPIFQCHISLLSDIKVYTI